MASTDTCRLCAGPSHGRNVCVYCETDQPRHADPLVGERSVLATMNGLPVTVVGGALTDAQDTIADLRDEVSRLLADREALREKLADEVGRSPEAVAAGLYEAGASYVEIAYHPEAPNCWRGAVLIRTEKRGTETVYAPTIEAAYAAALAWLRGQS